MLFDDSLVHSVEFTKLCPKHVAPNVERVVLIVDLWHPQLTQEERQAIMKIFPASW